MSDADIPANRDTGLTVSPGTTYPSTFSTPLDFVNPDAVLSGTNRGIQNLGSPSLYADGGNNRIVAAPNNNPSVLMGNQPTFGNGFYVGKPGVNVITNTDPDGFIFNSNQNVFKIVKTVPLSLTFTRSSSTFASYGTNVAHGLTFIPSYMYELNIDPSLPSNIASSSAVTKISGLYNITGNVGGTYTTFGQVYCMVDATNVYFQIDLSNLSSGTYTCSASVNLIQKTFGS